MRCLLVDNLPSMASSSLLLILDCRLTFSSLLVDKALGLILLYAVYGSVPSGVLGLDCCGLGGNDISVLTFWLEIILEAGGGKGFCVIKVKNPFKSL